MDDDHPCFYKWGVRGFVIVFPTVCKSLHGFCELHGFIQGVQFCVRCPSFLCLGPEDFG